MEPSQITKPSTPPSTPAPAPAPAPAPSQNPPPSDSKKDEEDKVVKVVKVANGWKTEKEKEGFIYVSIKGNAKERGIAHGELLADRIIKFIQTYAYYD
jgi:hypothetical protein